MQEKLKCNHTVIVIITKNEIKKQISKISVDMNLRIKMG